MVSGFLFLGNQRVLFGNPSQSVKNCVRSMLWNRSFIDGSGLFFLWTHCEIISRTAFRSHPYAARWFIRYFSNHLTYLYCILHDLFQRSKRAHDRILRNYDDNNPTFDADGFVIVKTKAQIDAEKAAKQNMDAATVDVKEQTEVDAAWWNRIWKGWCHLRGLWLLFSVWFTKWRLPESLCES